MQNPEFHEGQPEVPAWIPPPPPPEREELIAMLLERYGFLAACMVTVLVLGVLFLYPDLLLNNEARLAPSTGDGAGSTAEEAARLSVSSNPARASVWLDGDSLGVTPLVDYPMPQGRYLLSLQRADHVSVDTVVYLAQGSTSFFFALSQPASSGLSQEQPIPPRRPLAQATIPPPRTDDPPPQAAETPPTQPEQAEVDPPPTDPVRPSEGSPEAQSTQTVGAEEEEGDADTAPEPLPTAAPQEGELQVTSQPSGATVLRGDEVLGLTPLRLSVSAGSQTLTLQREGYEPYTATVDVEAGQIQTFTATLSEPLGTLKILARPWGSIFVNGQLRESESNVWYTERLAGGSYRVKVEHPSLGKWERIIDIVPGEETEIVADLNPRIDG